MKTSKPFILCIGFFICLNPICLNAQCTTKVTHLSGTVSFPCTDVTVTSSGSVSNMVGCPALPNPKSPYWVGRLATGAYTFSFSQPVVGVKIDIQGLDNASNRYEELTFEINGAPYPITNPGIPDNCQTPAELTPWGNIIASPNTNGSWDAIIITENISTITVKDTHFWGAPLGVAFSLYFCCPDPCPVDAGVMNGNNLDLCPGQAANTSPSVQFFLESNDLLQYVLFSNPNDTIGSIIATSNTPSFTFNPATMQTGVTYYIAAMAGNGVNGNVDLNDPCLDFSNALQVVWRPLPSVTFTVTNPDVCAGGCTSVTATFTGTSPFTLTYTTPGGGPQTQTFSGNTGTFQVCVPAGAPAGSFQIAATTVTDAWCTCE
jgi:hypothetical protein